MLMASAHSNGSPPVADDHRRNQLIVVSSPPTLAISDANTDNALDVNDFSEGSTGKKRKREGKLRSRVWQHFTKLIKEDGSCEKCKCNHCNRLFTCSSRSGTTHLLRHITDGICPASNKEKKDKSQPVYNYIHKGNVYPWKLDQGLGQASTQQPLDVQDELLPVGLDYYDRQSCDAFEDDYRGQPSPPTAIRIHQPAVKPRHRAESWMNELRACVGKLVDLTNERFSKDNLLKLPEAVSGTDYSLAAAVKCLNEMEDIPQSTEMYLDAFEIIKDASERECFICLNPEPRRRWLQRMLHRCFPSRYSFDV